MNVQHERASLIFDGESNDADEPYGGGSALGDRMYVKVNAILAWLRKPIMKRFPKIPRWAGVIFLLINLLVGAIITVYVVLPAIVQAIVNHCALTFLEINMLKPTDRMFFVNGTAKLSNYGPFSARITPIADDPNDGKTDPVVDATPPEGSITISYEDVLMAYMFLPDTTTHGSTTDIALNEKVVGITNHTQWTHFAQDLVAKNDTMWKLSGVVHVTVLGHYYPHIKLNKEVKVVGEYPHCTKRKLIEISGFGNLANNTVSRLDMPSNTLTGGINMSITIVLQNPSVISMYMGDMPLRLYRSGQCIGNVKAYDVTIVPGANVIVTSGELKPENSTLAAPVIEEFFNRYVHGLPTEVIAMGTDDSDHRKRSDGRPRWVLDIISSLNITTTVVEFFNRYVHGLPTEVIATGTDDSDHRKRSDDRPRWVLDIISSLNITTTVVGPSNMKLIGALTLGSLGLTIPGIGGDSQDSGVVPLSSDVTAGFYSPFDFPLSVTQVAVKLQMIRDNAIIASSTDYSPFSPAKSDQAGQILQFSMSGTSIIVSDREKFGRVTSDIVLTEGTNVTIGGWAKAYVSTVLGIFVLDDIPFQSPVYIGGFSGFPAGSIRMVDDNQAVTGGYVWGLTMVADVIIRNPTIVSLQVSSLALDIFFQGTSIGNITMRNVNLKPGDNSVSGDVMYVSPSDKSAERVFFSRYTQGNSSTIQLHGNHGNVPLLSDGMLRLSTQMNFTGQKTHLLAKVQVKPALSFTYVQTVITLANPFETVYSIKALQNFLVYDSSNWSLMGNLEDTAYSTIVPVPFGLTHNTKQLDDIKFQLAFNLGGAINALLKDSITIGVIQFMMGDYGPVTMDYQQSFKLTLF
ncbi:hypothetical protein PROFUN_05730 [Planoprotostelium fungivorum]|uniref:Transmembrane protein n=1 Tax=Planoprotostelium fungivorum TaxID=1890364 RepID=A0A2P6NQJ8_9EUKA|nr:hypothetical protein PROFUN_05730 [Planoprotostelium fungivorum]